MKRRGIFKSNMDRRSRDGRLRLNMMNRYTGNGVVACAPAWRCHWIPANSPAAATPRSRPRFD
jgi:hypothetical protein